MLNSKLYRTANGPVHGIEANIRDVEPWHASIGQIRDTVLAGLVVGTGGFLQAALPRSILQLAPTQNEIDEIAQSCHDAVRTGRVIDFGEWTNDVIKYGGNRGGPLYQQQAIGHPFRSPYMFVHSWEGVVVTYLVTPLEPDKPAGDCEAIELQPMRLKNHTMLMISDRIHLETSYNEGKDNWNKYNCLAMPSIWRYLPGMPDNGMSPPNAAAGNVLDPLMTAMLILSTKGVPRETIKVSDKLQNARRKNGKPPIPPYDRVISASYVTAITNRKARGRSIYKGGTHASPIPHLRIGHSRVYANGVKTRVRDALVNMSDEAKKAWLGRTHYIVEP